jgi:hypothetical protein
MNAWSVFVAGVKETFATAATTGMGEHGFSVNDFTLDVFDDFIIVERGKSGVPVPLSVQIVTVLTEPEHHRGQLVRSWSGHQRTPASFRQSSLKHSSQSM